MLVDEEGLLCADGGLACEQRDLELTTVFSVANVALLLSSLPMGFFLERFGPKVTSAAGNVLSAIGAFVIAGLYSSDDVLASGSDGSGALSRPGAVLLAGFTIISFAGPSIQLATMPSSFLFPGNEATVVGLLSGAMGGSAIAFPLYRLAFHTTGLLSLNGVFWVHGGWSIVLAVASALILPLQHFDELESTVVVSASRQHALTPAEAAGSDEEAGSVAKDGLPAASPAKHVSSLSAGAGNVALQSPSSDTTTPDALASQSGAAIAAKASLSPLCTGGGSSSNDQDDDAQQQQQQQQQQEEEDNTAEEGSLTRTTWQLVAQPWYIAMSLWTAVQYLRLVFWLGTADLRLRDIAPTRAEAESWLEVLGWVAPLGILAAPAAGQLQDRFGTAAAMIATQVLGIIHAVFSLVPVLDAQPVTFLAYTWQQEALFAVALAAVIAGFGAAKSGIGTGIVLGLSAACSTIVTPMTAAVLGAGQGFFAVDMALLVLTVASASLPVAQCLRVQSLIPPKPRTSA